MAKGTLIHGIGASEHLDSSGERISIKGLDISSLERGEGVLNYEHKNEHAAHIVGKVIKAKKIFSAEDCETEQEKYFWNRAQVPFLYIVGELFDGAGHQQAKEIAAMLKYDSHKRAEDPKSKNVVNFSVEGAKLEKQGNEITKAIARKLSITVTPCNKAAVAEELRPTAQPQQQKVERNPLDVFKTEEDVAITIISRSEIPAGWLKKSFPAPGALTGTQALTRENLVGKRKKKAEDAFNNWPHRDKLVKFLQTKNPSLSKTEAVALAKVYVLRMTEKAEKNISAMEKAWTPSKSVMGGKPVVALSHPEHGTVSVQQHGDQFHVRHNGGMAGLRGNKGIYNSAKDAVAHAKAYTQALSAGTVAGKKMMNVPSNPTLKASEPEDSKKCPPTHEGDKIEPLKKPSKGRVLTERAVKKSKA